MSSRSAETKMERLSQILLLFSSRPEGVRTAEIAAKFHISQKTARRYLGELSASGRLPVYKKGRTWRLVEGGQIDLLQVRLNLNEAVALYLSARLLAAHSDKHNPHVVEALYKLAAAMPESIGAHVARTAEGVAGRRRRPHYLEVLETLTRAWMERRQVRLCYRGARRKRLTERVFDTYFIEPSATGYACYAIGYDHLHEAIRIFKVERIQSITLLHASYEMRADFDPYAYLAHAWGIMGGDSIREVKLRFAPEVVYRVKESDWPGVAGLEEEPGGSCVLTLRVTHVLEMKPWIRSWGPDCEVLEPAELRREIAGEMKRAGEVYR